MIMTCSCQVEETICVLSVVRLLQAYHGGLQHVRDPSARAFRVDKVVSKAAAAVDAISRLAGLQCQVVTGGGSGTYRLEAASGVFTEVQPGGHSFLGYGGLNWHQAVAVRSAAQVHHKGL